jgi:hypothetical protein
MNNTDDGPETKVYTRLPPTTPSIAYHGRSSSHSHQGFGGIEAPQITQLAPDNRSQSMADAGQAAQTHDPGKLRRRAHQTLLARFSLLFQQIVQPPHPLQLVASRRGQLLLRQLILSNQTQREMDQPRPVEWVPAERASPHLNAEPRHQEAAAGPQPRLLDRRRREPGGWQPVAVCHLQLPRQTLRIQAVVFLSPEGVDRRRVHPLGPLALAGLFQHTHDIMTAGVNLQGNLRTAREFVQRSLGVFPWTATSSSLQPRVEPPAFTSACVRRLL